MPTAVMKSTIYNEGSNITMKVLTKVLFIPSEQHWREYSNGAVHVWLCELVLICMCPSVLLCVALVIG